MALYSRCNSIIMINCMGKKYKCLCICDRVYDILTPNTMQFHDHFDNRIESKLYIFFKPSG